MIANTTVALYAGVEVTADGDEVDSNEAIAKGVPFSIEKTGRRTNTEASQVDRVVQYAIGRCRPNVSLKGVNRIRDERTGDIWLVDGFKVPNMGAVQGDTKVMLKLVIR